MPFTEEVEGIGLNTVDILKSITSGVRSGEFDDGSGDIHQFDTVTHFTDLNRKTSRIAECVQGTAPCIMAGGAMIVALIQIGACLLPRS